VSQNIESFWLDGKPVTKTHDGDYYDYYYDYYDDDYDDYDYDYDDDHADSYDDDNVHAMMICNQTALRKTARRLAAHSRGLSCRASACASNLALAVLCIE
jgi:hypothetical protein